MTESSWRLDLSAIEMRSLDAIHLTTALDLGSDLARVVTYDERMAGAAQALGLTVTSPS